MPNPPQWPLDVTDEEFFFLLRRHRITSAVWQTMQHLPIGNAPATVTTQLAAWHAASVPHALKVAADLVHLNGVLGGAGIKYLTLKGPPLAIQYYGGLKYRHSKDLDLWIGPNTIQTAIAALQRDGYRCSILDGVTQSQVERVIALSHHLAFEKPGATPLELHTRLMQFPQLCQIAFSDAYEAATWVPIAGQQVPVLSPAHLFTYLCVHGAVHEWERLKWLADLPRMLSVLGWTWNDVYPVAQMTGSIRTVALAEHLCTQLFQASLEPSAQEHSRFLTKRLTLRLTNHTLREIQRPTSLAETRASFSATIARWRYYVALSPALPYKLAVLTHVSAPTVADLTATRLPNALYPLYFLIRPIFWMWRRLTKREPVTHRAVVGS